MKKIILLIILSLFSIFSYSNDKVLKIDIRHRPPEMMIDENENISGPLKDIIEIAANDLGYKVEWRIAPFKRSLEDLKTGKIDIAPRVIETKERKEFLKFLHPIAHQVKLISFLVKKGQENLIGDYKDLNTLSIGVKRGTVYFEKFDNDKKLKKVESVDDKNLSKMFIKNRFDTMIVLDKLPLEEALDKNDFNNFSYAKYKEMRYIKNCYALSSKSKNKEIYNNLNKKLIKMVSDGTIKKIYEKYKISSSNQFFSEGDTKLYVGK